MNTTTENGIEWLADGDGRKRTYANRTQAVKAAAKLGSRWQVHHPHRAFLVGRTIALAEVSSVFANAGAWRIWCESERGTGRFALATIASATEEQAIAKSRENAARFNRMGRDDDYRTPPDGEPLLAWYGPADDSWRRMLPAGV